MVGISGLTVTSSAGTLDALFNSMHVVTHWLLLVACGLLRHNKLVFSSILLHCELLTELLLGCAFDIADVVALEVILARVDCVFAVSQSVLWLHL